MASPGWTPLDADPLRAEYYARTRWWTPTALRWWWYHFEWADFYDWLEVKSAAGSLLAWGLDEVRARMRFAVYVHTPWPHVEVSQLWLHGSWHDAWREYRRRLRAYEHSKSGEQP